MSLNDLDTILPTSNADKTDDDDYEPYSSDSDDDDDKNETDVVNLNVNQIQPKQSPKRRKSKKLSKTKKILTKRPKNPRKSTTVGNDKMPALHVTNPVDHVLEQPQPMFVKRAIDNEFTTPKQLELSDDMQNGVRLKDSINSPDPEKYKELFDADNQSWHVRHKKLVIIVCSIVMITLLMGAGIYGWFWYRRRKLMKSNPLDANDDKRGISGGDKCNDNDDECNNKDLNYVTSASFAANDNPQSLYDVQNTETEDNIADNAMQNISKMKVTKNNNNCNNNCNIGQSRSRSGKNNLPQRDKNGRFMKRK